MYISQASKREDEEEEIVFLSGYITNCDQQSIIFFAHITLNVCK